MFWSAIHKSFFSNGLATYSPAYFCYLQQCSGHLLTSVFLLFVAMFRPTTHQRISAICRMFWPPTHQPISAICNNVLATYSPAYFCYLQQCSGHLLTNIFLLFVAMFQPPTHKPISAICSNVLSSYSHACLGIIRFTPHHVIHRLQTHKIAYEIHPDFRIHNYKSLSRFHHEVYKELKITPRSITPFIVICRLTGTLYYQLIVSAELTSDLNCAVWIGRDRCRWNINRRNRQQSTDSVHYSGMSFMPQVNACLFQVSAFQLAWLVISHYPCQTYDPRE